MKGAIARSHSWEDANGEEIFRHRKRSDGSWGYWHRLPPAEARAARCSEHGEVEPGRYWCPRKPGASRGMLYQMPKLVKAIESGADVLWCAGEKDADRVQEILDAAGSPAVATCVHQGESAPVEIEQADLFLGFTGKVLIYFDRDVTGIAHALNRRQLLRDRKVKTQIRAIPGGVASGGAEDNDISDYLDRKGSLLSDCKSAGVKALREAMASAVTEKSGKKAKKTKTLDLAAPRVSGKAAAGGGALLKAFQGRLGPVQQRAGDRNYWNCPHPAHDDASPSFSVAQGSTGALVLACSCPGGMAKGEEHKEWVSEVLAALGAGWEALTGRASAPQPGFQFLMNDQGNAQLLVALHDGDLLCAGSPGKTEPLAWDGRHWARSSAVLHQMATDVGDHYRELAETAGLSKAAKEALGKWGLSSGNKGRLDAMKSLASFYATQIGPGQIDARPNLLAVANGTLELGVAGAVLREHRREDHLSRMARAAWEPSAASAKWDDFLAKFVPDLELRAYLQKILGYSLLGINSERLIIVISGGTSTGKTTIMNIVHDALGPDLAGTFQLSMMRTRRDDAPRPDILKVMDRRFIFAEEGSTEWKLHADTIKQLTSGGLIEARGMRSDVFTEKIPAFTPFLVTNAFPSVQYADAALKRRLVGFAFTQFIPKSQEDGGFRESFTAGDHAAVLAWLMAGYTAFRREGLMAMPAIVLASTKELRGSLSPVDMFVAEMCVVDSAARTTTDDLYREFTEWWRDSGSDGRPMSRHQFALHLSSEGFKNKAAEYSATDQKTIRFRYGLRLSYGK